MERTGLVWRVEEQLERMIALGMLPEDGSLPSEGTLARRYGVSRATLREALLRLEVRGLVVQHPGRRTRARALDEALTLENLGVALHAEGSASPERQWLLEGYFTLKREVAVELLAAACEHASEVQLDRLGDACFALGEAARWEEASRWVEREFELLRLAARAADRPGQLLLIHSLERAWRGMASRVLPCLDAQAVQQWAKYALNGLGERGAEALRRELPALLRACDERVLSHVAPDRKADALPEALPAEAQVVQGGCPEARPDSTAAALPGEDLPNLSACQTGSCRAPPTEGSHPVSPCTIGCGQPERLTMGEAPEPRTHPPPCGEDTPALRTGVMEVGERGGAPTSRAPPRAAPPGPCTAARCR